MDPEVSEYIPDPNQIKTEAENYAFNFDEEDQSQIDKNTKDGNQTNPKYIQLLKDVGTGTFRRDESADYSELSQLLAENIKQLRDNYKRVHRYTMSMPKGDAIKILGDFARANRAVAEIAETHSGKEAVQTASK
jgi:hypothetical protein